MNIMIIGANGLLGMYLVDILKDNTNLFAVVKNKNKIKFEDNKVNVVEIDLANFNVDTLPKSIDVVFYLAQSNRFREFPEWGNLIGLLYSSRSNPNPSSPIIAPDLI